MCGVVGIYGHPEAANLAYLGLYALQHRGQESAGIVASDGERLRFVREMGHVGDIFTADRLAQLRGFAAIGHVRYSTAGESALKNAQPIAVDYSGGSVAMGWVDIENSPATASMPNAVIAKPFTHAGLRSVVRDLVRQSLQRQ